MQYARDSDSMFGEETNGNLKKSHWTDTLEAKRTGDSSLEAASIL